MAPLVRGFRALLSLFVSVAVGVQYEPTWASIDSRPLPPWYDAAKVGIFLHWGVYSVPSFGVDHGNTGSGEWFWNLWKNNNSAYVDFVDETQSRNFAYPDYASSFTAEFFHRRAGERDQECKPSIRRLPFPLRVV